jgi:hypothetical protein
MPKQSPFVVPHHGPSTPGHCLTATALWHAVLSARAAWARERHLPQNRLEPNARIALLDALEAYVESLDERGQPVPYELRDELRLRRLTCGPSSLVRPANPGEELGHGHSVR